MLCRVTLSVSHAAQLTSTLSVRGRYAAVLVDLRHAAFHVDRCRQELHVLHARGGVGSFSRTVMDAADAVPPRSLPTQTPSAE